MTEKFFIGQVGAPFGVKGFVKIRSLSGEIDHLLDLQSVTVSKDGKEQILKIEETSSTPLTMRFAGINSPEAAKTLNGAYLVGGRDQAAPLDEGEYYIEDLKGLPVTTGDGKILGFITDIIEGGGGERLIPFRKEFFPEINPEKSRIILQNLWILD
jgi:16S rRNA processing protein RimM